jgi:hypothetical protein
MARKGVSALLAFALAVLCLALGSCKLPASKSVDLLPGVMTFTVDYVADGGTLAVTLPVENQGSAAAAAFMVEFYLAATSAFDPLTDTNLGPTAGASVPANSTGTVNASLSIPELNINEVRYVYAVVDSTGAVDESDETNNQSTTGTAAEVLVYNDESPGPYSIIIQTYLGSDPSKTTGSTDTVMALYHKDGSTATYMISDMSTATDFSLIDMSSAPLASGTYYIAVLSSNPNNGPYALSVRTSNIGYLPRFVDLSSNAVDPWETDDLPVNSLPMTEDKSIPTVPALIKVGGVLNRYSDYNAGTYDWDWFTFVLP